MNARTPFLRRVTCPVILWATLAVAPAAAAAAAPAAPVVTTGKASAVTYQSAVLAGKVNPSGESTTYFFQYGPTTTYGGQSAPVGLAARTVAVAVQEPIGGLVARTTYHYRLVAINATGTRLGADATFTTAAIPLSLSIVGLPSPTVFGAPVSIAGTLSGTGASNREVVLQANPFPFTAGFQNIGNPLLTTTTGGFQFNLLSLGATTQFRVVSVGSGAPVLSPILTEYVRVAVTLHVTRKRSHRGSYVVRFSGLVSPAEVGARVSLQRLTGSRWRLVKATSAAASSAGSSSYRLTLHLRHGGFYRTYVRSVEGAHVDNVSPAELVHA